jgi:hypothetical protein
MTTFKALAPFSVAEAKLMSDAGTPDRITVGDGVVPEAATPDCEIRASLIRALLLDPDSPLHDKGLRLRGLHLSSCHARGISANNAQFVGSLYLRSGTMVEGEISTRQCSYLWRSANL